MLQQTEIIQRTNGLPRRKKKISMKSEDKNTIHDDRKSDTVKLDIMSELELDELLTMRAEMLAISPTYKICPHCGEGIEVVQENCKIFICGASENYTEKSQQLPPHDDKGAERARAMGKIKLGCGNQFELIDGELKPCAGK